ncbi:AraC-like DNA-binding protein [Luteibacter sp. HA06]
MRLIANIAQTEFHGMPPMASLAHLTQTDSGWLLSLVLRVSDKRLIGSHLAPSGCNRTDESSLQARLAALASRLGAEGPNGSVVGGYVARAARVLEQHLRRRRSADDSVLSAKQLRIAMLLLGSNLDRTLHTPEVATACGISEGHLRRAFKTCTGLSPSKWRQEKRLQLCRTKLVETDEPMVDIARQAGFVVQSHFSRVFTRATGTSPSEWRRLFQSANRALAPAAGSSRSLYDAHAPGVTWS